MTTTLKDLGIPGLIGVLLGWVLNQAAAARGRREQRAWEEEGLLRTQEREAAAALDESLADASETAGLPTGGAPLSYAQYAEASHDFRLGRG